ncbi:DNA replication protein [Nocardioides seonyuensis]|uniref:DNA replication protein n=2 Tax=Nocardioides seonyuensis TaxID=2518371 RepID=A0A4P7IL62_9ACTN|nr:DNA replication protein [Nocardioides seonyuensis]
MSRVAAAPSLVAAARRYASLGIPVFPCVTGGKQPLTPNGFHDASVSLATVERWWRRTPDANIGLPTGVTTGVLVVDVDVHGSGSGYEAFDCAHHKGLTQGWGWLVRTPSGGMHAYYPTARDEQRCWQVPGAHIDFRGDGGYVIAPPSRLEVRGKPTPYEVIAVSERKPMPLDAAKLRLFLDPPKQTRQACTPLPPLGTRPERLAKWMATQPEGGRNQGLFWAACRLVEDGHPIEFTIATLGPAGVQAGLPQPEVESTIVSAYRTAVPRPRVSRPGPTPVSEAIAQ